MTVNIIMLQGNDLPNIPEAAPVKLAGVGVAPTLGWVESDEFPTVDILPMPPTGAQSSYERAPITICGVQLAIATIAVESVRRTYSPPPYHCRWQPHMAQRGKQRWVLDKRMCGLLGYRSLTLPEL